MQPQITDMPINGTHIITGALCLAKYGKSYLVKVVLYKLLT